MVSGGTEKKVLLTNTVVVLVVESVLYSFNFESLVARILVVNFGD